MIKQEKIKDLIEDIDLRIEIINETIQEFSNEIRFYILQSELDTLRSVKLRLIDIFPSVPTISKCEVCGKSLSADESLYCISFCFSCCEIEHIFSDEVICRKKCAFGLKCQAAQAKDFIGW